MTLLVKICGLRTLDTLAAALAAGADMVGFVRHAPSPRHVDLDLARSLSAAAVRRATRVLLLVDPDDATLDEALAAIEPDLLQLHGAETPGRVAAIRARTGLPVMKALGVAGRDDLDRVAAFRGLADRVLLDAKAPPGAALPGGNGVPFDWSLLDRLDPGPDLMLSGGLTPGNVGRAIAETGMQAVDVSSGVESRPGEKDPGRIAAFIQAAHAASGVREPAGSLA